MLQENLVTLGFNQGETKITVLLAHLPQAITTKLAKMSDNRLPIRLSELNSPPFDTLTQDVLMTSYTSQARKEASK